MAGFLNELLSVLKQDPRFFADDDTLLRNAVYEAAMQMDGSLIGLLLENEQTRGRFFKEVNGVQVFDKVGFGWVINNRQFLPDSYTRFKNKIGLVDHDGELISSSGKVELVFPYKDCVLEGGQTKEDQKRSEIFYNETLGADEIDRLLYPKVLCGATRYSAAGEERVVSIDEEDNLVVKGNNLLTISSLLKRHEGRVKCIYIDVPYNTGNDGFGYNDRFNHSTWLCFMKNRLEIAHRLLSRDGTIAISVDNYELGYLLVLLDEIFGRENRKNIITVKRGSATGGAKVINPGVVNVVEYVVLYSKDTAQWRPNRVYASKGFDTRYNSFVVNIHDDPSEWVFKTLLEAWADELGIQKNTLRRRFGAEFGEALNEFALTHAENICRLAAIDDSNVGAEVRDLKQRSRANPDQVISIVRADGNYYYAYRGQHVIFASSNMREIDGVMTFSQPVTDIWDDVLPNDLSNEGGVVFRKGKKPEKLIGRIVELCTNEGDLVLDFFAGSGTTGAVCMKMGRRFILCEQMDYVEETTCSRLRNTIDGEGRGISSQCSWAGGDSFIYCELAKLNQLFVDEIEAADDHMALRELYKLIVETGYISYRVDPSAFDDATSDFEDLTLENQKLFLLEILDKNMLYVNYCDMEDEEFHISEEDKAFTRSFYREG